MHVESGKQLDIQERKIGTLAWSEGLVWFDFEVLCGGPRSAADYIEIARQYHTVLVSGVPVFQENMEDKARRFITLVDEFYDHGVKLVLSAAADLPDLYRGADLQFLSPVLAADWWKCRPGSTWAVPTGRIRPFQGDPWPSEKGKQGLNPLGPAGRIRAP